MAKRVIDLTSSELNELATEAWADAALRARKEGRAVIGSRDGRLFRYHPNGTAEDLGPVKAFDESKAKKSTASRKSVA
jgi:hypothetical protein